MKNYIINDIISGNEIYHRKMEYTCCLCKSDMLSDSIFQKRELKSLLTKFKMTQSDLSTLIDKCNCTKNSTKAHKLCVLLNIIYNFELKCPECNTEYNINVKIFHLSNQKLWNIVSLILVLLINIIFYGACAFLFLYPFVIKKNFKDVPELDKFLNCYCFFGAVIFIINTFLIYITFNMFLIKNPNDTNSYAIEIKDINDQNKKRTDKHYILLYKFYRSFYKTQTRYLITKKHKNIFISKGYGYFNKELKEIIIKNNLECEKEEVEEENNGGDEILGLKENKTNKKSSNKDNDDKISNNIIEKSNGNIDNSNSSDIDDTKNNEESKNKIKNNNNINANLNIGSTQNNNILNKSESESKHKKSIENTSKKSNSVISDKNLKKEKKKIVIEIINTDKQKNVIKNSSLGEERKNQDNESNKTKKSDSNKINIKNRNKKNENDYSSSKNKSEKNKKFEESKETLYNRKEEKKETSKKINLVEDPNDNDNEELFISSPFHNNGK